MEAALIQNQITAMDKAGNVVLDVESLTQTQDRCCSGSPKTTRALSRKGSNRMERRNGEEHETDVVPSQLEQAKMPLLPNKALLTPQSAANSPVLTDSGEGRSRRFTRLATFHPRKVVLLFATVSSVGSMILIYFTLAINRRGA